MLIQKKNNLSTQDNKVSPAVLERRRKAMRHILAGGGVVVGSQALPAKWARPVVDSLILPAHAVASASSVTTTPTPTPTPCPTTCSCKP